MVIAILLFMGASMLVDPGGFTNLTRNLVLGMRNLERHTRGTQWRYRDLDPSPPAFRKSSVRAVGVVLIVLALLATAFA